MGAKLHLFFQFCKSYASAHNGNSIKARRSAGQRQVRVWQASEGLCGGEVYAGLSGKISRRADDLSDLSDNALSADIKVVGEHRVALQCYTTRLSGIDCRSASYLNISYIADYQYFINRGG